MISVKNSKIKKPLVVYLCNAIEETVLIQRSIKSDSPAATNKVISTAKVMRIADIRCLILSLGRGRQSNTRELHCALSRRSQGCHFLYCTFLNFSLFTHLVTAASLCFQVMHLVFRNSNLTLLSYNRSLHYIPALFLARLLLVRSCLDLEDGYIFEENGIIRRSKNFILRKLYGWLCPHGTIIANSGLAAQLDKPPVMKFYGVAFPSNLHAQNWNSGKLQLLFGGTLSEGAGCKLFLDAIDILYQKYPEVIRDINIVVTGKGPFAEDFHSLTKKIPELLSFSDSMRRNDYLELLRVSHIGLSLRITDHEMSTTTFPSKVIEYSTSGLLILSTRSRDMTELFANQALYLEDESAQALADLIASLPNLKKGLQIIAKGGRERVIKACSPNKVIAELKYLLFNDSLKKI